MNILLHNYLLRLEHNPEEPFLIHNRMTFTYSDFARLIACHLHHLQNNQINVGEPVGLLLRNSPEFLISYYSLLFYGAIPVIFPLNLSTNRLTYLINKIQIDAVISQPEYQKTIDEIEIRKGSSLQRLCCDLNWTMRDQSQSLVAFFKEQPGYQQINPLAEIVFSSGYSGYHKVICHSFDSLINNCEAMQHLLTWRRPNRVLIALPLPYFGAHAFVPHAVTRAGATIILPERLSPEEIAIQLANGQIDTVIGTPAYYEKLLSLKEQNPPTTSKLFIVVGNQLTEAVYFELRKQFAATIYHLYGSAETQMVALNRHEFDDRINSLGRLLPGWEMRLADQIPKSNSPASGMLYVRGKSLMTGYFDEWQKAPLNPNKWFNTGDWCHLEEDFLYFESQNHERIKRFGYAINPVEIEKVLKEHPAIQNVIAVPIRQVDSDDQIKLYIQASGEIDENQVREYCQEHLPPYLQPEAIEFVHYFERDLTGKILRNIVNKT